MTVIMRFLRLLLIAWALVLVGLACWATHQAGAELEESKARACQAGHTQWCPFEWPWSLGSRPTPAGPPPRLAVIARRVVR